MIPLFKVFMNPDAARSVSDVLNSGMITQSKQVEKFENELQKFFNYPYILTLNSATSGLTLSFRLLNLKPGDEVLTTALTCFATNAAILANNLKIKWVDVDPDTCNINLDDLKSKITAKTKAICFVHWGGSPVNLDRVEQIKVYAKEKFGNDIKVVEDAAHAFGSKFNNKYVGTHGNLTVFSTQAIKHLTTGDGGLIFLPNKELYDRAKLLRWYGISREKRSGKGKDFRLEEDISEWGYKFHMNDINATIGLSNLPHIQNNLQRARDIAKIYDSEFADVTGVTPLKQEIGGVSSYWIYTIKIINKDGFIPYMNRNNIMVSQVHNRNDNNSCVSEFKSELPLLDELEKSIVSIPIGWWMTKQDTTKIIKSIEAWCKDLHLVKSEELKNTDMSQYIKIMEQIMGPSTRVHTVESFGIKLKKIKDQNSTILIIKIGDKIIATGKLIIELKFFDEVAHIEDVVVDKDYRHFGLGQLIVQDLLKIVPGTCYRVILDCKSALKDFYGKMGFIKENSGLVLRL